MGGEDRPADVAVGGHGCQFPPGVNNRKVSNKNLHLWEGRTPQCLRHCNHTELLLNTELYITILFETEKNYITIFMLPLSRFNSHWIQTSMFNIYKKLQIYCTDTQLKQLCDICSHHVPPPLSTWRPMMWARMRGGPTVTWEPGAGADNRV